MDWPASFPDVNQIKNVWSDIKYKPRGKHIFTLKQLSIRIRKLWRCGSRGYAEKLVECMPSNN